MHFARYIFEQSIFGLLFAVLLIFSFDTYYMYLHIIIVFPK